MFSSLSNQVKQLEERISRQEDRFERFEHKIEELIDLGDDKVTEPSDNSQSYLHCRAQVNWNINIIRSLAY